MFTILLTCCGKRIGIAVWPTLLAAIKAEFWFVSTETLFAIVMGTKTGFCTFFGSLLPLTITMDREANKKNLIFTNQKGLNVFVR